jgi:hypothetical protein
LWQFDALRGLMLVLMTLTHVPTRLTEALGQPFGFVSAAFGFVFISGLLVGRVQGRRRHTHGLAAVRASLWRRAGLVYACHLGLVAVLFWVLPLTGIGVEVGPIAGMRWFFDSDPGAAIVGAIMLIHQPGLLDILPMYVIFLLLSAPMLACRARAGWAGPLALSVALWLLAQTGLPGMAYEQFVFDNGLPIPRAALGTFNLLAWQLVWFGGLLLGAAQADGWQIRPGRWPRSLIIVAGTVALTAFAWRHGAGMPTYSDQPVWATLFDKWHMGPLRLLNAVALAIVLMRFGPRGEATWLWAPLRLLGRAALPVFMAHALVAMLVLGIAGDEVGDRSAAVDLVILALTFSVLFMTAWIADRPARPLTRSARSAASTA